MALHLDGCVGSGGEHYGGSGVPSASVGVGSFCVQVSLSGAGSLSGGLGGSWVLGSRP